MSGHLRKLRVDISGWLLLLDLGKIKVGPSSGGLPSSTLALEGRL